MQGQGPHRWASWADHPRPLAVPADGYRSTPPTMLQVPNFSAHYILSFNEFRKSGRTWGIMGEGEMIRTLCWSTLVLWASLLITEFPSAGVIGKVKPIVGFRFSRASNLSKIRFWIKIQFWNNIFLNVWLNQKKISLSLYNFQIQIMHSLWCVTDFCRRK